MPTTITSTTGTGSINANAMPVYRVERRSRNIVHEIAGGGTAVTVNPGNPRSGRIQLMLLSDANALGAMNFLSLPRTFQLTVTERPLLDMTFTVDDNSVSCTLDPVTAKFWLVDFGFEQVIA